MKNSSAIILVVVVVAIVLFIFTYATAIEELATPRKIDDVAGSTWNKPQVKADATLDVLPPGVEKKGGDVPGKGNKKGWQLGNHKGWQKADPAESDEATGPKVDEIKAAVEDYISRLQGWLNERPNFQITEEEGGVSGYRQEIKDWLDERPESPDDIVKEITPSG